MNTIFETGHAPDLPPTRDAITAYHAVAAAAISGGRFTSMLAQPVVGSVHRVMDAAIVVGVKDPIAAAVTEVSDNTSPQVGYDDLAATGMPTGEYVLANTDSLPNTAPLPRRSRPSSFDSNPEYRSFLLEQRKRLDSGVDEGAIEARQLVEEAQSFSEHPPRLNPTQQLVLGMAVRRAARNGDPAAQDLLARNSVFAPIWTPPGEKRSALTPVLAVAGVIGLLATNLRKS